MAYKPLIRRKAGPRPVDVDLDLSIQITPRQEIDAADDADEARDWALALIEEALDEHGADGYTLLEMLGWRTPFDEERRAV